MSRAAARRRRKGHKAIFAAPDPLEALAQRRARQIAEAESRRNDPARWGEDAMTPEREAALRAKGVEVVLNLQRRVVRAHKQDIWATLAARDALTRDQLEAVRRLERDMIQRAGHGRAAPNRVIVDAPGDICAVTDRMVEAGRRVDSVLALVGPPSCRLLVAIIEPGIEGRDVDWRPEVHRLTGESAPHAQAALLRVAAQALHECYERLDEAEIDRRRASPRPAERIAL